MKDAIDQGYSIRSVFLEPGSLLRLVGTVLGGALAVLLFLGFGFLFAFQGLVFAVMLMSPYSEAAFRFVCFLARKPHNTKPFMPVPLPWWRVAILALHVSAHLAFAGAGIWLIGSLGVCGQNLICLLATTR